MGYTSTYNAIEEGKLTSRFWVLGAKNSSPAKKKDTSNSEVGLLFSAALYVDVCPTDHIIILYFERVTKSLSTCMYMIKNQPSHTFLYVFQVSQRKTIK